MSQSMRIGVCDDSEDSRQQVLTLLVEYARLVKEVIEPIAFSSAQDLVNYSGALDLLFLDIELGEASGIDLVPIVRQRLPQVDIIFISAHSHYFIYSHRLQVFQFLMKPFNQVIFFEELDRFLLKYRQQHDLYVVQFKGAETQFPIVEIIYLEAALRHVMIYHSGTGGYEMRGKISQEEKRLQPYGFIRCHQSFLVNPRYIDDIKHQMVYLSNSFDGSILTLAISKNRVAQTKQQYHTWLLAQGD